MKAQKRLEWTEKTVKLSALKPYERNPRRITEAQYEKLKNSLNRNGYHQRIIATPDLRIIGGHQRIKALSELGITEVQVLVPNQKIAEAQFREMLVTDNLPFGEFDYDILSADFDPAELIEWGMPESWLPKFTDGTDGLTDPDELPATPPAPRTSPGDIWILGEHRIMCGDSTSATDVETLLNGATPNLMVTDPPYGVDYDPKWRERHDKFKRHSTGKVENDDRADWREAWALFPGNIAYVWCASLHNDVVIKSLEENEFERRAQIIWVKQHFTFSRGDYHWQHEPCWYAVRNKGNWCGDRKQTTVWEIENKNPFGGNKEDDDSKHGTQKPVECMKRPIENNSSAGDAVYEPFSGSGTTIIAAEMTGRRCYAMEISPEYVDLAVSRWQRFTGKEAVNVKTGEKFNH